MSQSQAAGRLLLVMWLSVHCTLARRPHSAGFRTARPAKGVHCCRRRRRTRCRRIDPAPELRRRDLAHAWVGHPGCSHADSPTRLMPDDGAATPGPMVASDHHGARRCACGGTERGSDPAQLTWLAPGRSCASSTACIHGAWGQMVYTRRSIRLALDHPSCVPRPSRHELLPPRGQDGAPGGDAGPHGPHPQRVVL